MAKKNREQPVAPKEVPVPVKEDEVKDIPFIGRCSICGREQYVMGGKSDLARVSEGRLPVECGTHDSVG